MKGETLTHSTANEATKAILAFVQSFIRESTLSGDNTRASSLLKEDIYRCLYEGFGR